jgi:glycogen debranching enzyme
MIEVPDKIVKNLLEAIDDVAYYLHNRGHKDHDASDLLTRLREVKHDFENTAKSKDGSSLYQVPLFRGDDIQ